MQQGILYCPGQIEELTRILGHKNHVEVVYRRPRNNSKEPVGLMVNGTPSEEGYIVYYIGETKEGRISFYKEDGTEIPVQIFQFHPTEERFSWAEKFFC